MCGELRCVVLRCIVMLCCVVAVLWLERAQWSATLRCLARDLSWSSAVCGACALHSCMLSPGILSSLCMGIFTSLFIHMHMHMHAPIVHAHSGIPTTHSAAVSCYDLEVAASMADIRVYKWCGRASTLPNPLTKHAMSAGPTLPFRSGRSLQCKPCFNAIAFQAGGDGGYRDTLSQECATEEGRLAQRERTMKWEEMYNSSPAGRVIAGDRNLRETAQVSNNSYMELEMVYGIIWPLKLAQEKLGRKPTRKELKTYSVGGSCDSWWFVGSTLKGVRLSAVVLSAISSHSLTRCLLDQL